MKFKLKKMGLLLLMILNILVSSLLLGADVVSNSASFSFPIAKELNVNARTGALVYKKQLMQIPGKNGLDVDISFVYTSEYGWKFSKDEIRDNIVCLANGEIDSLYSNVKDYIYNNGYMQDGTKDNSIKYKDGTIKKFSKDNNTSSLIETIDRYQNKIKYSYGTHYNYNHTVSALELEKIEDTYGNFIEFSYQYPNPYANIPYKVVTITYQDLVATITYDSNNNIMSIKDTGNRTTTFSYASNGNSRYAKILLAEVITPDGMSTKITYGGLKIYSYEYIPAVESISEKDNYSDAQYHELAKLSYRESYKVPGLGYGVTINFPQRDLYREYSFDSKHMLLSETLVKKAFATTPVDRVVMKKTYNGYYTDNTKYPLNIVTEYSTDYDYLTRILSFSSSSSSGGVSKSVTSNGGTGTMTDPSPNISKSEIDPPLSWSSDTERIATRKVEETYTYDEYGNRTSEKTKDFLTGSSVVKAYSYYYNSDLNFYALPTSIEASDESSTIVGYSDATKKWYGKKLNSSNINTIIKKIENYPTADGKSIGATVEYGDANYKRLTTYTYNADGRAASETIKENNQTGLNIAGILADNSEKVVTDFSYSDNLVNSSDNQRYHSVTKTLCEKNNSKIITSINYSVKTGKVLKERPIIYINYFDSEYKYDSLGRITESRKKGDMVPTRYSYSDNVSLLIGQKNFKGNSLTTILPNGQTTIEIFNGHGKVIAKGERLTPLDRYCKLLLENQYKDEGELLIASFDAKGNKTNYLYDYLFRNVGVKNPDGTTKFSIIDDSKNRVINIDEERITSLTNYDEFGKVLYENNNLSKVTSPLALVNLRTCNIYNATTRNSYDSIGNLISVSHGGYEVKGLKYDPLGRLLAIKLPSSYYHEGLKYTKFDDYSSYGNFIWFDSRGGMAFTKYFYTYNLLGQVVEKSYDKNSSNDYIAYNKKIIDKLTYDYRGNLLSNIYGDKNEYNYFGLLMKKTDSKGQVFTYSYYPTLLLSFVLKDGVEVEKYTYNDNQQILTKETKNNTGTWDILKYEYKANGLTESISYNNTKTNTYEYDENNLVKSMTDAKGNKYDYTYDNRNKLTEIRQANETGILYDYYGNGTVKAAKHGENTESYEYNDKGLLSALYFNNEIMYQYKYNNYDNITEKKDYLNNETTFYSYTGENKLVESSTFETGKRNFRFALGVNNINEPIYTDYTTNNLFKKGTKYLYTDFGDISKVISYKNSVDKLGLSNFKFDTQKVTEVFYGNVNKISEENYSYSERDSVDPAYKGKTVPEILTRYAKANYSFAEGTSATASLESNIQYAYDLNGNLIKEDNVGKIKEYTYDAYNKLTAFKDADNKTAEYIYYPDGMRKSKSFDGKTTTFYYDNQNIIGEDNGTSYTSNIFGPTGIIARKVPNKNRMFFVKDAHDDIIRTAGTDGTPLVTPQPVAATPTTYPAIIASYYYFSTFDESVMKTISTYKYEDYGKVIDNKGATDNPYRYSGEYTDDETGFQYLRVRYYNPNIRRFITEDTYTGEISNPLTLNLYGYCEGNPIMYTDPSGHGVRWDKFKEWCKSGSSSENSSSSSNGGGGISLSLNYFDAADSAKDFYANKYIETGNSAYYGLGMLATLGDRDTWKTTAGVLAGGYAAGKLYYYALAGSGTATLTNIYNSTPVGKRGYSLEVMSKNNSSIFFDRVYSGHALDRMQGRGIPPTVVENAIKFGAKMKGNTPNTIVSVFENVKVITNESGKVITVISQ